MSKANLMLGTAVEISLILGPLVLDWAPNHFVLGAQLAPSNKWLVCIPEEHVGLSGRVGIFVVVVKEAYLVLREHFHQCACAAG